MRSLHTVPLIRKRTEPFATPGVERASMVSGLSAGNIALPVSVTTAPSVSSLSLTAVVLDIPCGVRALATMTTRMLVAARSGASSGTLSADPTSTTLLAAFAHQTALQARLTSVSLALRIPTVVEQATCFLADRTRR